MKFIAHEPERPDEVGMASAPQRCEAGGSERNAGTPPPPLAGEWRRRRLDGLADIDDVVRQLADLFCVPLVCRRRSCRKTERCSGGAGPPCVYEEWTVFVGHFEARTRDIRRFWARQRLLAKRISASEGDSSRRSDPEARLSGTGEAASAR